MNPSLVLAAVLGLGMSVIYILPPFQQAECALDTQIPEYLGSTIAQNYQASEKELAILAKDTKFSKARCLMPRFEERSFITNKTPYDLVDLSVVLSGYDLANSIHRPERCMPAQGHKISDSSSSTLELANGRSIPITRLVSKQSLEIGPPDERQHVTNDCLTYYFFVGHSAITNSHTERTLIDIKDRVFLGSAQRWAFVSATMRYVPDDSKDRPYAAPANLEMADKKIRELLRELADKNINWAQVDS